MPGRNPAAEDMSGDEVGCVGPEGSEGKGDEDYKLKPSHDRIG